MAVAEDGRGGGIVIAIDGPSGSGKSSTSRGVARRLGLRYLDTGAQYRAMTWWMLEHGVDLADGEAVAAASLLPRLASATDPDGYGITVDGRVLVDEIRTGAVDAAVSKVAGVRAVRTRLIEAQRECVRTAVAEGVGIVVEGRDIAEVVWPIAPVKVYLTADQAVRAARREAEHAGAGRGTEAAATLAELARRDAEDAKTTRPLDAAPGAVVVDGTHLSLDEVVEEIVRLAKGQ
ncbi:(d)CMP kinase [Actinospica durhamensis]|uniref:Cytidylate kinase n=1 Tax=Actinospica durhamensis TaxID=1508375 RepID=A0A941EUM2_9ACTN|nr:(d)CMP kinase [Actinospica durhamensis]MBR7837985.1 (d)CMP kinase [Actinospica durhamensis]